MVPGIAAIQDVLKVFFLIALGFEVILRNFNGGYTFRVSPYSFRLGSVFSGEYRPGEYNHLVWGGGGGGFSLILHLAHHIAKFRRSCCKNFATKRTFKLKAHCAVPSVN